MTTPRPTYRIDLTPTPAAGDPTQALRRALKALLRQYGLRCVRIEQVVDQDDKAVNDES